MGHELILDLVILLQNDERTKKQEQDQNKNMRDNIKNFLCTYKNVAATSSFSTLTGADKNKNNSSSITSSKSIPRNISNNFRTVRISDKK